MKTCIRYILIVALGASSVSGSASAFEATLTKVAPIKAHPAGSVARDMLEPVEGVPVAPPRAPVTSSYMPETAPQAVPVPVSNPLALSWCSSDIL